MTELSVLVGLGNPGPEHAGQRHNAGFWLIEALLHTYGGSLRAEKKLHADCARISVDGHDLLLVQPTTFMNRSGRSVQAVTAYYKLSPQQVIVAHDELDLPAGVVRLKRGGGHGGHNGLRDVTANIGPDYARIRLGIGHPGDKSRVLNYVLGRPSSSDELGIRQAINDTIKALPEMLQHWDKAVQGLHTQSVEG